MNERAQFKGVSILAVLLSSAAFGQQTYSIQTFAGGGLPNNVAATSASIGQVAGVAVDAGGNVFMTSLSYHAVSRLDAKSGMLTLIAGTGTPGFSGDNGPAVNAQFNQPYGIALDAAGNIYVADTANNRIREISGGMITTIAGNGTAGTSGDGGPATSAELYAPHGVAVDGARNVYIASSGVGPGTGSIREVSGEKITSVSTGQYVLFYPWSVAVDPTGNLYFDDVYGVYESAAGQVTRIMGETTNFNGAECPAAPAPALSLATNELTPTGLAVAPNGDVFVSGRIASCVQRISRGTVYLVAGTGNMPGDGGPATSAYLNQPLGLALDQMGNLYVADSIATRLRVISAGTITTAAGGGVAGENGAAVGAQLNAPAGIAFDSSGSLYFADSGNSRVGVITNSAITTVAGNGTYGASPDETPAVNAELGQPTGVAVDTAGTVYIADTASRSLRDIWHGSLGTLLSNPGFPMAVAADAKGNVYVSASREIAAAPGNSSSNLIEMTNGKVVEQTTLGMKEPQGLNTDPDGKLYIADTGDNKIEETNNSINFAFIAGASPFIGGFYGDQGPAPFAWLNAPQGVAADAAGNVYIADTGNNRIRRVSGGVIATIAGTGTPGYSGDGGPATNAGINSPIGIVADSAGNLYFSDSANNRIRMLVPSGKPCTYSVPSSPITLPPNGGNVKITVQTAPGCSWVVGELVYWLTATGNVVQQGAETISITAGANTESARTFTATIAGQPVTFSQASGTGPLPAINQEGVVPIYTKGPYIQPGSWISIYGSNFAAAPATWNGDFPQSLGGVSVTINGKPGYLWYVSPTQINLQAPDDTTTGVVNVVVTTANGVANSQVDLGAFAPSLSLFDSTHAAGVILTPDGSGAYGNGTYDLLGPVGAFNFKTRPAKPGETIELYGVGFGPTNPAVAAGRVFSGSAPMVNTPTAKINNVSAQVAYAGITSAGLYQFNIVVPNISAQPGSQDVSIVINLTGTTNNGGQIFATATVTVQQ